MQWGCLRLRLAAADNGRVICNHVRRSISSVTAEFMEEWDRPIMLMPMSMGKGQGKKSFTTRQSLTCNGGHKSSTHVNDAQQHCLYVVTLGPAA